uniref:Cytochrome b-c1 complex subunit 10 n=1 Tax=Podarcis muralis TaxID=64176 RepID=A0A670KMS2_PODMU
LSKQRYASAPSVLSPSRRVPTLSTWGTVGAVGLVWVTDWRLILDYVPWINGKFKKDD